MLNAMTIDTSRILAVFAGVLGAAGVAGAAAAAHGYPDSLLMLAAGFALVHAPAVLVLALAPSGRLRRPAVPGFLLVAGTLLFSADIAFRVFLSGGPLFPRAAPTGGLLMIAGWLAVAVSALAAGRPRT